MNDTLQHCAHFQGVQANIPTIRQVCIRGELYVFRRAAKRLQLFDFVAIGHIYVFQKVGAAHDTSSLSVTPSLLESP